MNDYELAMAKARLRCTRCGCSGRRDCILDWCRCGNHVVYGTGRELTRNVFHGRFEPARDERTAS